jgi:hypothetical protein
LNGKSTDDAAIHRQLETISCVRGGCLKANCCDHGGKGDADPAAPSEESLDRHENPLKCRSERKGEKTRNVNE